jgi:hypothetical protein
MKFMRPTGEPSATRTELDVQEIHADIGDDLAHVVVAGYGMPDAVRPAIAALPGCDGCFAYVAYDGATPAAAGVLFVRGDLGWLSFAATLPDQRRKGGQGAILAARIARAHGLSVEMLVTETGVQKEGRPSNSYRNILRSGFQEVYVRENYLSP